MRIGGSIPQISFSQCYQNQAPARHYNSGLKVERAQLQNRAGPGVVVDISPEGWAAYGKINAQSGSGKPTEVNPTECKTCASRRYVDGSNDSTVSFQSPTHVAPGQAAAAVSSHESEHVANEQDRAEQEGREVVSQSVRLITAICPECKRVYVAGGVTQTVTVKKDQG